MESEYVYVVCSGSYSMNEVEKVFYNLIDAEIFVSEYNKKNNPHEGWAYIFKKEVE